ncbi:ankyrin repeat protein [Elusimicrobium simillimum]|uniref:ankyrin repeat domain-containing protein n=1 Tax=Elusimicrobium simillimum TaxID=3143438 RepID=UPI003C6FE606
MTDNNLYKTAYKAAAKSDGKTLQTLLDGGLDINAQYLGGDYKSTLLVRAVYEKDAKAFKTLLKYGADMDAADERGNTAWDYIDDKTIADASKEAYKGAAQNFLDEELEALIKSIAYNSKGSIFRAEALLAAGADGERVFEPEGVNLLFFTLTDKYWGGARELASPEILERMLKAGVNPGSRNAEGKTALIYEIENINAGRGMTERVALLLKYGADVNAVDNKGMSALTKANVLPATKHVSYTLLESGAKRDVEAEWFLTAYEYKNDHRHYNFLIKQLLADKANINALAKQELYDIKAGQTALLYMAAQKNYDSVRDLIDNGADVNIKDNEGRNMLHYIALMPEAGETDARKIKNMSDLFFYKGGRDLKDIYGKTAFDYALENNNDNNILLNIFDASVGERRAEMADKIFAAYGTGKDKKKIEKFITQTEKLKVTDEPVPNAFEKSESWTKESGLAAGISGTSYFFSKDGRFSYSHYYSGGIYFNDSAGGTYNYDAKRQTITLKTDVAFTNSPYTKRQNPLLPHEIKIIRQTADAVETTAGNFTRKQSDDVSPQGFLRGGALQSADITAYVSKYPFKFTARLLALSEDERLVFNNFYYAPKTKKNITAASGALRFEIKLSYGGSAKSIVFYPEDNLLFEDNKYYKLDPKNNEVKKFKKLLASYLKN